MGLIINSIKSRTKNLLQYAYEYVGVDLFFLTLASRNSSGGRFDHLAQDRSIFFFRRERGFVSCFDSRPHAKNQFFEYIYIGLYPISYVLRLRMLLVLKQQKDTTEFSCDTDGSHSMVTQSLAMRLFLPLC